MKMAIKSAIMRKHIENAAWMVENVTENVYGAYDWLCDQAKDEKIAFRRRSARERAINELALDIREFNVGICGPPKSGKSSLINALRDTKSHSNLLKAPLVPDEASALIVAYPTVDQTVTYWKTLDSDCHSTTAINYVNDNHLLAFDLVLILTGCHLRNDELEIAKHLHVCNVEFAFVRSKSDEDLGRNVRLSGANHGTLSAELIKRQFWETGQETFGDRLCCFERPPKVFFVSATHLDTSDSAEKTWLKLDEHRLLAYLQYAKEMAMLQNGVSHSNSDSSNVDQDESPSKETTPTQLASETDH